MAMALNQHGNSGVKEVEVTFPDPSNPDPIDPDIINSAVIDPVGFPGHDDEIDPGEDSDVEEEIDQRSNIDPLPDADLPEPDRPTRDISNRHLGL
jgi:hypothetical protein